MLINQVTVTPLDTFMTPHEPRGYLTFYLHVLGIRMLSTFQLFNQIGKLVGKIFVYQ